MTINPKALEAACNVAIEYAARIPPGFISSLPRSMETAISAYLAALPAGDEAEVVKRLRHISDNLSDGYEEHGGHSVEKACDDAASLIERQSATIAQLRGEVERLQRECDQLNNSMGFAELAMESISNAAQPAPDLAGKPESDGWIEWRGGECPVARDRKVLICLRNGTRSDEPFSARSWVWEHDSNTADSDIIAYRVAEQKETR